MNEAHQLINGIHGHKLISYYNPETLMLYRTITTWYRYQCILYIAKEVERLTTNAILIPSRLVEVLSEK